MSTKKPNTGKTETGGGYGQTCQEPGCRNTGGAINIAGRGVENAPVLCDTHRKEYLGVST